MLQVRKVVEADRPLIHAANLADPYHRVFGPSGDHWINENSIVYSDSQGPVVALCTTHVARVDIQFLSQERMRNREALLEGFWAYIALLKKRGIKEIIFNTKSVAVANFFKRRFRFRHLGGDTYSLRIAE